MLGSVKIKDNNTPLASYQFDDNGTYLLDKLPVAICSCDALGYINYYNKAAVALWGREPEAGRDLWCGSWKIYYPDGTPMSLDVCPMALALKEGVANVGNEIIIEREDGIRLNILPHPVPVFDIRGKLSGAINTLLDINDYKKEEQRRERLASKLKEYSRQLEQLNRHKDEFIGMASHELKTPLTSIKANLQLLQRRLADNSNSNFINIAVKQVGKLSSLISNLLDVSKIEAGKLQLDHTLFDMNSLILECIDSIGQGTSHAIIYKECKDGVMIHGDRLRIEHVIINLLSNAVKYSPLADQIIVECYNKDSNMVVCIKDFGIGIPKSKWDKIFSRFYRVEGLALTFSGLGIGLYISHDIIDRHKGKMWVKSEEGKGSSFYFSLPLNRSK